MHKVLLLTQVVLLFYICGITSGDIREGKSNSVVWVKETESRQKRATNPNGLTQEQQQESVEIHNALRRMEGASNMEKMIWNDYLAQMAQDWAAKCIWDHGQPDRDKASMPYDPVGQNLYFSSEEMNVTYGVIKWYEEKQWYEYDTKACTGPMCGHYTQVVWAESREIGCGYVFCDQMVEPSNNNKVYDKSHYLVCEYGPAGNMQGEDPFKKGEACTECPNGKFWCDKETPAGLCSRECTQLSDTCDCKANCQNFAEMSCDCSCQCQAGFMGITCADECKNNDDKCGANPGFPKDMCTDPEYGKAIKEKCPLMCEVCKGPSETPRTSEPERPTCLVENTATKATDGGVTTKAPEVGATTKQADGAVTTKAPDGRAVTKAPDSGVTTKAADGAVTTKAPDGGTVTKAPDGAVTTKQTDGAVTTKAAEGAATTKPAGGAVTTKPAGGAVTTKPAGGAVTTKPAGDAVTTKPADGGATTKPASGGATTRPAGAGGTTIKPTVLPEVSKKHAMILKVEVEKAKEEKAFDTFQNMIASKIDMHCSKHTTECCGSSNATYTPVMPVPNVKGEFEDHKEAGTRNWHVYVFNMKPCDKNGNGHEYLPRLQLETVLKDSQKDVGAAMETCCNATWMSMEPAWGIDNGQSKVSSSLIGLILSLCAVMMLI